MKGKESRAETACFSYTHLYCLSLHSLPGIEEALMKKALGTELLVFTKFTTLKVMIDFSSEC